MRRADATASPSELSKNAKMAIWIGAAKSLNRNPHLNRATCKGKSRSAMYTDRQSDSF
jgi:hypothetical protein